MPKTLEYSVHEGVYVFPTEYGVELHLKHLRRDRHGQMLAEARFVTRGGAILALSNGDLGSGIWRNNFVGQAAARNSGNTVMYENTVIEALVALENDQNIARYGQSALRPRLVTASELIQSIPPTQQALVEGLFETGTLQAIVAKPKVAKTLLVLELAMVVSKGGGLWMGRKVAGGRVVLFQLEDSARTISNRMTTMLSGQLPGQLLVHHPDTPFQITDENYPLVVDACRGCSLVVVDPIIQASRVSDWNAASEVRAAYELWRRLARELDAVVVVVAHHRKQVGDFGDQIAGSIQGLATPDGIIELRRDSSLTKTQRKVSFVGRDWPDLEDEVIELDPQTLRFTVIGTASVLAEDRGRQSTAERAMELVSSLPATPPGMTYGELSARTGLGDKALRPALDLLKLEGRVEVTGTARSRTNPLRFYQKEQQGQLSSSSSAGHIYGSAEDEDKN